jgi:tetratricopeptide (TPR) repeat protein
MAIGDFRVFVSAVSNEFGKVRSAVASDLRSRKLLVKVEDDFRLGAGADTLLRKLHDYIRDCSAVVCIMGNRSGTGPTPTEAAPFAHLLPPGVMQASYTQWEFFLARHFRRNLYLYLAEKYDPDGPSLGIDDSNLQRAYVQHIQALGLNRQSFGTDDELRRKILREEWTNSKRPKPIVLPYPSLGDLFKGRDEFLQGLNDSLRRGGHTAIVSHAFYGLGGIGKTRAAVEYAWAHRDAYSALLFVVAETPEALRRNLAALTSTLVPELDTTDDAVRLQAVLDWLMTNPGWFLIFDNVDTKTTLAEVERILGALSGGHVVVTSRLADFSGNFQPLELGLLAMEDAAAFLLARTEGRRRPAADDEAKARGIAAELGRLALALEQAAAFIAKRRLTFGQYLEQWRLHGDQVLAWFDETVTGYPRAVAVTWQTSIAQLSEGGRRLLERLAWLAPEKVPEFLLDVPIPGAEAEDLHKALDDLAAYSLVTRDAEGPFFLIHRLVQDVTRRSLLGVAPDKALTEALNWMDGAWVGDARDVRHWSRLELLAPHARASAIYADGASISKPTSRLMNELGRLFMAKALHSEAEPLLRRGLAIDEKELGPDHTDVAIMLNNLASLLRDTSRYAEAEPLMRRVISIIDKNLGPDVPLIAIALNNLAGLLQYTNRFGEAEPLRRRALAIDEKNFGPNHPNVGTRLSNLAVLLRKTGRFAEAEPLIRRAIVIAEENFGPDHPTVSTRLNNLCTLLTSTNRFAEAEPLIRRALAIDEKSYGADHPEVATDLNNLSQVLQQSKRYAEAEPLMRRQAAIFVEFTRRTGYAHPHLESAFQNYAALLEAMGKNSAEIETEIKKLKIPISS